MKAEDLQNYLDSEFPDLKLRVSQHHDELIVVFHRMACSLAMTPSALELSSNDVIRRRVISMIADMARAAQKNLEAIR